MDQKVERRIRDRAYSIWEEEGCPADRDVDHWLRAAQEIAAEEGRPEDMGKAGGAASEKPKKPRGTRGSAKSGTEKEAVAEKVAEPGPKPRRASKSKAG